MAAGSTRSIQRVIEILRSIPTIPLWMGLAAAVPQAGRRSRSISPSPLIISLIGWTELARVVRGRFLALREEDFVTAAELAGASRLRIIFRHMLPSFLSPHHRRGQPGAAGDDHQRDVAVASLASACARRRSPGACCCRTRRTCRRLGLAPWLLFAAVPVIVVILAFNFLGDGLRDAADPYG